MNDPARDLINKFYAREARREAAKKSNKKNRKPGQRVKRVPEVGSRSVLRKGGEQ
jgi:hypothetical protein